MPSGHPADAALVETAREMRATGMPVLDIARRLGMSVSFVYHRTSDMAVSATRRREWHSDTGR